MGSGRRNIWMTSTPTSAASANIFARLNYPLLRYNALHSNDHRGRRRDTDRAHRRRVVPGEGQTSGRARSDPRELDMEERNSSSDNQLGLEGPQLRDPRDLAGVHESVRPQVHVRRPGRRPIRDDVECGFQHAQLGAGQRQDGGVVDQSRLTCVRSSEIGRGRSEHPLYFFGSLVLYAV